MRSSARRHARNKSIKHRLKTLEKRFRDAVASGGKDDATAALRAVSSALDKAAKTGVIHKANASRKKSRLAKALKALA